MPESRRSFHFESCRSSGVGEPRIVGHKHRLPRAQQHGSGEMDRIEGTELSGFDRSSHLQDLNINVDHLDRAENAVGALQYVSMWVGAP